MGIEFRSVTLPVSEQMNQSFLPLKHFSGILKAIDNLLMYAERLQSLHWSFQSKRIEQLDGTCKNIIAYFLANQNAAFPSAFSCKFIFIQRSKFPTTNRNRTCNKHSRFLKILNSFQPKQFSL